MRTGARGRAGGPGHASPRARAPVPLTPLPELWPASGAQTPIAHEPRDVRSSIHLVMLGVMNGHRLGVHKGLQSGIGNWYH